MARVTKDITIEELVTTYPKSVKFLMDRGIKCIACGEPIWGTLGDAILEKGKNVEKIVEELNAALTSDPDLSGTET
ncbi:MAG: DUF1858 domain-containing protein [Bacteroidota bacterium]